MIDAHCHVDLYPDPLSIANECERLSIYTIAMTNLPSHFEMGFDHLISFKKIRLALGMHPLYADRHKDEFALFEQLSQKTSYIGEVGLDYSKDGIKSKSIQNDSFDRILSFLKGRQKVFSIHSRSAESDTFKYLKSYDIKSAIFHWYTGSVELIPQIAATGYFFSVNSAMINSTKGQEIIKTIPASSILTESDGPFIQYENRPIRPSDLSIVTNYLSKVWKKSPEDTNEIILQNFTRLIKKL